MEFNVNSPFLYVIALIVIVFVIVESIYFLIKAMKRAKELNIDKSLIKRTITTSALFTILPAVAILLGVITLTKLLGIPLPWVRLSVLGALTYEVAAAQAAAATFGLEFSETVSDPQVFATIAWIMTLGIMMGIILLPIFQRKIQKGVAKMQEKDSRWGQIFMSALFIGMISAFLGLIFNKITTGLIGWVPVFVMICSAVIMLIMGALIKLIKVPWLQDFALPVSMLGAMALAIPITNLVSSIV